MNINVTKPFLPPLEEYNNYLRKIWERGWLTNNGPLLNELELKLKEYLGVEHLLFLTNGTIALQIAIRALDLKGEIITTPFSYVATTSSIVWENCQPIMVDICPDTLNIDYKNIEKVITDKTTAILAVHVFGNPCNIEAISEIAKKYDLRVIYDAAHAFGTFYKSKALVGYGNISTCSFHATKLFHTIEGGAVITQNPELLKKMALMRNFGHTSATEFGDIGINGKNSELHAAMGLCNLKYIGEIFAARKRLFKQYKYHLTGLPIKFQTISNDTDYNYSYFPVIFKNESILLKVLDNLNLYGIYPRRYFLPSLSELPYVKGQKTPISEELSRRIMCLPLYHMLSDEEVGMICRIIKRTIRY